jgi:hypothetical protein
VTELGSGTASGGLDSRRAAGPTLVFRHSLHEVWRSDGTAAGTYALATGGAQDLTARTDVVFYTAPVPMSRWEDLWSTDGTAAGTADHCPCGRRAGRRTGADHGELRRRGDDLGRERQGSEAEAWMANGP